MNKTQTNPAPARHRFETILSPILTAALAFTHTRLHHRMFNPRSVDFADKFRPETRPFRKRFAWFAGWLLVAVGAWLTWHITIHS